MRRVAFALLAGALLVVVPTPAFAAKKKRGPVIRVFGSTLNKPPTDYDPPATCDTSGTNTDTGPCTRVAVGFGATGAVKGRVRAPTSGFVRSISIRAATAGAVRVKLARLSGVDFDTVEGQGKTSSNGALLHTKGRGLTAVEKFRVKLRVRKGDYLAVDGSSSTAMNCTAVSDFQQLLFQPPLDAGAASQASSGSDDCTLLVQATIKPKAKRKHRKRHRSKRHR